MFEHMENGTFLYASGFTVLNVVTVIVNKCSNELISHILAKTKYIFFLF